MQLFRLIGLLGVFSLSACTSSFYKAPPDVPTARLRVVSRADGNTGFYVGSRDSCKKGDFMSAMLGWFHPGASQGIQANRRGFNRRLGMPYSEGIPNHLYAENLIGVKPPPRILVDNVSGFTFGVVSTLNFCGGFYDVDFKPNLDYEIVAYDEKGSCRVKAFRLAPKGSVPERIPMKIERACIKK